MSGPCRCLYPRRAPVAPVVAVPCALARMRARAPGRPGDSNGESAGRADQLECRHQCAASFGEPRRSRGERARTHRLVRGTLPLPAAAAAAVFCPLRGPLVADAAAAVCCLVAHAGASTWSKWAKLVKLSAVSLRTLVRGPQPAAAAVFYLLCGSLRLSAAAAVVCLHELPRIGTRRDAVGFVVKLVKVGETGTPISNWSK